MRGQAEQEHASVAPATRRAAHCPTLSVILLSQGDRMDLERALAAVASRCRRMEAEMIVVRSVAMADVATLSTAYPSVTFLEAPAGCDTTAMREVGMTQACGDVIALRLDQAVGDGSWLDAFRALVGTVEDEHPRELEVPLPTSTEEFPASGDRRRPRQGSFAAATPSTPQKRRSDTGRASAGFADVGAFAQTLRPEM